MHIQRDTSGAIVGLLQRDLTPDEAADGRWRPVDDEAAEAAAEVQAFLRRAGRDIDNPLAETDANLARVTEDLIDILIDKGVIQFTDLPPAAQNKLLQRRQTRSELSNRLNLLGDGGVI